jgi:putative transcriptional regulator
MTFAEALKSMRKELNLSQEALAHELKVSFATINKWENNKTKPIRLARERILDFSKSKSISIEVIDALKID